jgi:hypothetical protein
MDLRELYEKRRGLTHFKERDLAVKVFENYYHSRDPQKPGIPQITYRPYNVDNINVSNQSEHRYAVNLSRRVVGYFSSMFAHPPRTWKSPLGGDIKTADRHTLWLAHVFQQSRLLTLQPRQSHWLSMRGDCVYAVDWDAKRVFVRTYDPAWCYPTFSNLDMGKVEDMLICFQVPSEWANRHYGSHSQDESCHVFIYWDDRICRTQVGLEPIHDLDREHHLGFCPFRWVFGSPDGSLAEADIRDVPSLQDLYNENLLLAMDSIRKTVDPAYWGAGLKGNIQPEPGVVIGLPNEQATINQFPTGGDPHMIMGVMEMLNSNIEATSGISPISSTGRAQGSIVTGSAVRHQVEAIESRAEARRAAFEDCYAQLGAMCFQVLEKIFPKKEQTFPIKGGEDAIRGSEIEGWYDCYAQYGEYFNVPPEQRIQLALQGLGRIYDDKMAIRLAGLPDVTPEEMAARIDDYQTRQGAITGKAQAYAQLAAQQAQQQQPPPEQLGGQPGMPPEMAPQRGAPPTAPGAAGMNVTLQDVERALKVIESQLKGPVWATDELAVVGMSAHPVVVVGLQRDLPVVNSVMHALHGIAVVDAPKDAPRLELV